MRDATGTIVERVRRAQKLSRAELSRRLTEVGCPIPELGLSRIGAGQRRVDITELLALAVVLGVHPVDLLVPAHVPSDREFAVTSRVTSTVGQAREWIAGAGLLVAPADEAELADALRTLPPWRALRMLDRYREAS